MPERNASSGVGGMADRGGRISGATSGVALPSEVLPAAGLGLSGSGTAVASGRRLPSKLIAGERPTATPSKAMLAMNLDIRIARPLGRRAGMGDRALARRSHLLGVFPQISRGEFGSPGPPGLRPCLEFSLAEFDLEGTLYRVHGDDVAVAQKGNRAADRCLRT